MEREELHSAFVRRFPAISLSHSHMHTHAHSWIYCHSVRLARTASMGEILMGYICLLLRVCKLSLSLVAISKGQVWSWGSGQHVTGGSGKVVAQCPAQARRKQEWATKVIPTRCSEQAQCIHTPIFAFLQMYHSTWLALARGRYWAVLFRGCLKCLVAFVTDLALQSTAWFFHNSLFFLTDPSSFSGLSLSLFQSLYPFFQAKSLVF